MSTRGIVSSLILVASAMAARPAAAETYWTSKAILSEFFRSSEEVSYVRVDTKAARAAFEKLLGYLPAKSSYVVYVARTGGRVDGYAVLDEERGQHLPISLAVKLSSEGKVERTEVMVYREAYGGEVRQARFLRQFEGRRLEEPLRLGREIDTISGATISARSMTIGVRRAMALVSVVRATLEEQELARSK